MANSKRCKNPEKKTETLANGYSSESTQQELYNEYPHEQGSDDFQKSLHPCSLDESSLSIGRIKDICHYVALTLL